MQEATVTELWTYPVKACQGVAAESLEITQMGIRGDRHFTLWEAGHMVDQIKTPKVASLAAHYAIEEGVLRFSHETHGTYEHEVRDEGETRETSWVLDKFDTIDQGDEVANWLSDILEKKVRLVSPGPVWKINFPIPAMERVHETPKQRFFSASTVSLANQASLDDLNQRLESPVPMNRFRMNVIVDGLEPYAEDHLDSASNGQVELLQVTPAERCVIITTDQQTGDRPKHDLMKVLGEYRRKPKEDSFGSGIIFGNYMTVGQEGTLHVGDRLKIV
ncbi:MAG: MOSC N-terminal beta barrel domain-containing protein [Pseudomonadota bacterium]